MGNKMRKDATFKGDRTGWLQGVKEQEKKRRICEGVELHLDPRFVLVVLVSSSRYRGVITTTNDAFTLSI